MSVLLFQYKHTAKYLYKDIQSYNFSQKRKQRGRKLALQTDDRHTDKYCHLQSCLCFKNVKIINYQIKDTYGFNMNYDNVCTQFLGLVKTVVLQFYHSSNCMGLIFILFQRGYSIFPRSRLFVCPSETLQRKPGFLGSSSR